MVANTLVLDKFVQMHLDEAIEQTGTWNLAGTEQPVRGDFAYEPTSGLSLRVFGGRELYGRTMMRRGPFTIRGSIDGRPVSLLGCYPRGETTRGDITEGKFLVTQAVLNSDVSALAEVLCPAMHVSYTQLDEWVTPVVPLLDVTRSSDSADSLAVSLAAGARRYVASDEHADIRLAYVTSVTQAHSTAFVEHHAEFIVQPHELTNAERMMSEYVRPLENFVSFATGRTSVARSIRFVDENESNYPVELIHWPIQRKNIESQWWPHFEGRGLFSLLDINDRFSECICAWLDVSRKYKTVCDLFFGTIYNSRQFLETRFIALVQAAEGYHRQTDDLTQHRMPPARYRAIKKQICKLTPGDLSSSEQKVFQDALQHANDVSLRMRLDELSSRFGPLVPGVWEPEERESFGKRCANARNAFAHHLPKSTAPFELFRFNEYIMQLLGAAFMRALGFTDAKIINLMSRGPTLVSPALPDDEAAPLQ